MLVTVFVQTFQVHAVRLSVFLYVCVCDESFPAYGTHEKKSAFALVNFEVFEAAEGVVAEFAVVLFGTVRAQVTLHMRGIVKRFVAVLVDTCKPLQV